MVKQSNKKKDANPAEVGPASNPAKKSRVSELGEEKESPSKPARTEPKVYFITHGFDKSPKNWDFEKEEGEFLDDGDEDSRQGKQSNILAHKRFMTEWAKSCGASIRGPHTINQPF